MRDADCSAGRARCLPRSCCGRSGGDGRGYTGRRGGRAGESAGRRGQWRRPRCAAREGERAGGRAGCGALTVPRWRRRPRRRRRRLSGEPDRPPPPPTPCQPHPPPGPGAGCTPAAGRGGVTCCGAEPPAERGVSGAAAEAARGHGGGGWVGVGSRTAAPSARSVRNSCAVWA